jgi:proteasome accessory factor A
LARLHVIYYDMVLSPVANILKAGTTQLILAMIESGWTDPTLCLDDPVGAASLISRDLQLRHSLPSVVRGRSMTAVEIQRAVADLAGEFVAGGGADGCVPHAARILSLWLETLELLQRRDVEALAPRCDCWLKYLLLDRQRGRRNLLWNSNEMRVADSLFASLDPEVSLFFQAAASRFVEQMPTREEVARFAFQPPDETRAYFRAHVLRRYGDAVSSMDWSRITFRVPVDRHWWSMADIPMHDPRRFNRADTKWLFERCSSLEELVEAANALAMNEC